RDREVKNMFDRPQVEDQVKPVLKVGGDRTIHVVNDRGVFVIVGVQGGDLLGPQHLQEGFDVGRVDRARQPRGFLGAVGPELVKHLFQGVDVHQQIIPADGEDTIK